MVTSATNSPPPDAWVEAVERDIAEFCADHGDAIKKTERELAAYFEIGCFLSLLHDYERQSVVAKPCNLGKEGQFRYLTTPSGNPDNFSFVELVAIGSTWQLRQQVRIVSHLHPDIMLTPDIIVLDAAAKMTADRDTDFAGGKRGFYRVAGEHVIAAHECKSLTAFPELYASFVGLATICHHWFEDTARGQARRGHVGHLAPTLFVGGDASNLHRRMVRALEGLFPMNIVTGLHRTNLAWRDRRGQLSRIPLTGNWEATEAHAHALGYDATTGEPVDIPY